MHLNWEQILWALVLAGHLVLLIVLLGRDRASRFGWFAAVTALSTVHLIADHLLHGKLTSIAFYWQSYSLMGLEAIFSLFVLIQLAQIVFSSGKAGIVLRAKGYIGWTLVTFAIAAAAVWAWGPWPAWKTLNSQPAELPLLLVLLSALKLQLFAALLTVQFGILLLIFGRRFGYGLKSHAQQIAIGLSTNAICFLSLQIITEEMRRHVHINSIEERRRVVERVNHLFANLDNARYALWFLVLVWWIVCLWREEPGISATSTNSETPGFPLANTWMTDEEELPTEQTEQTEQTERTEPTEQTDQLNKLTN